MGYEPPGSLSEMTLVSAVRDFYIAIAPQPVTNAPDTRNLPAVRSCQRVDITAGDRQARYQDRVTFSFLLAEHREAGIPLMKLSSLVMPALILPMRSTPISVTVRQMKLDGVWTVLCYTVWSTQCTIAGNPAPHIRFIERIHITDELTAR